MGGLACVDCHADLATLAEFPHAEKLKPAQCATCHDKAVAAYDTGVHAQARRAGGNLAAATCADCHGSHDIRPVGGPGVADAPRAAARHLRPVPRRRGDHQARQDRDRQRRRSVQGQHPRQGAHQERPERGADVHGLPRQPRHPPQERPGEQGVPQHDSRHVQQVPRGDRPRVLGEHSRVAGGEGESPGAGLHELPHGARDPPLRCGGLEARGHQGVRDLPRALARDLPRHVPRPGDGARIRPRGLLRGLPRRAQRLPEVGPALDGVGGEAGGRRASSATSRRTRELRAVRSRTPTRRIASGTRCCSTRRSS